MRLDAVEDAIVATIGDNSAVDTDDTENQETKEPELIGKKEDL